MRRGRAGGCWGGAGWVFVRIWGVDGRGFNMKASVKKAVHSGGPDHCSWLVATSKRPFVLIDLILKSDNWAW